MNRWGNQRRLQEDGGVAAPWGWGKTGCWEHNEPAGGGAEKGKKRKKVNCAPGDNILDVNRRPKLRGQRLRSQSPVCLSLLWTCLLDFSPLDQVVGESPGYREVGKSKRPSSKGCLCHLEILCLGALQVDSQASAGRGELNLCLEFKMWLLWHASPNTYVLEWRPARTLLFFPPFPLQKDTRGLSFLPSHRTPAPSLPALPTKSASRTQQLFIKALLSVKDSAALNPFRARMLALTLLLQLRSRGGPPLRKK